jgi:glycerol dehydrogenase
MDSIKHIGQYLTLFNAKTVTMIITQNGDKRFGTEIENSLNLHNIKLHKLYFYKECSYEESTRLELDFKPADCVLAVGGGKLIDLAKLVSFNQKSPLIVFPTLASNDGPCSALSIMYNPNGSFIGGVVYPVSPSLVVVDLNIILNSPERTFVSGMGDAMATYYEAKTCFDNPKGVSMLHARPTLTAINLATLCKDILFENGLKAVESMRSKNVSQEFSKVVEANILLSGLGFESGGLASAHSVAQALTTNAYIEHNFMHGEMVAMGLLAMMVLQNNIEEYHKLSGFFDKVGLPTTFMKMKLDFEDGKAMDAFQDALQKQWFLKNEMVDTSSEKIVEAMKKVDSLYFK